MTDAPTLERAYRVRLSPKPVQARVLSRLFGARRWVWNWALREKDAAWRNFFSGRARRPRRRRFGTVQSARFTLDQRRLGLVTLQGKRGS
ncbi:MAG: helix-turn-helix domain-containing protein, partial [Xanthomonadaceae bacterium]|nr:helix-turn-helix domain-containing protein [Xanthomonadaceae bacterium]